LIDGGASLSLRAAGLLPCSLLIVKRGEEKERGGVEELLGWTFFTFSS
jgi:hypothetical protein